MPIKKIPKILNEEDIDLIFEEIVSDGNFEKSKLRSGKYRSTEDFKNPQEYDSGIFLLKDLKERRKSDPRIQATFERSGQNNLSVFIFSNDYHVLPQKTDRANVNTHHIFKPNKFRIIQNFYQDKNICGYDA